MSHLYQINPEIIKKVGGLLMVPLLFALPMIFLLSGSGYWYVGLLPSVLVSGLLFNAWRRLQACCVELGADGLRFLPKPDARSRNFLWSEVSAVTEKPFPMAGLTGLEVLLADGHRQVLPLIQSGLVYFVPIVTDSPAFLDAIKQGWQGNIGRSSEPLKLEVSRDLGREAGHVTSVALALALLAILLMVVSDQHYLNSSEYIPSLVVATVLAFGLAVRYQWRLPKRINMFFPTLLVSATSCWFAWSALLVASAHAGVPLTVSYTAHGSREAGTSHLESEQYWYSNDSRLPESARELVMWADPGHFRFKDGETRQLRVRLLPVLGMATVAREDYEAMLAPLSSSASVGEAKSAR